jgi:hypothetical protein
MSSRELDRNESCKVSSRKGHGVDNDEREGARSVGGFGWKERVGVSLVKAAEAMGVSYHHSRRIWKRYKANRSEGLVHWEGGRSRTGGMTGE